MIRKLIVLMAVVALMLMTATAMAQWQRPGEATKSDSLGTLRACNVGDGDASDEVLDTISTWPLSATSHTAGEALSVSFWDKGGGDYTYLYLWAGWIDSDTNAVADSNTLYVVLEQSIGGQGAADKFWVPVDSLTINGANIPIGKKMTFNGMPYWRVRSQDATLTLELDTLTVVVKAALIK